MAQGSGELILKGGSAHVPPVSVKNDSEPIRLIRCPSETSEAIAVVREIGRLVGGTGMLSAHAGLSGVGKDGGDLEERLCSFADFAVVARTSALCEELERCFAVEGIPCRVRGAKSFLRRGVIRRLLAFIRLAIDPQDDFRFSEALRLTGYKLPKTWQERLATGAEESGRTLLAQLKVEISRSVPLPEQNKEAGEFLLSLEKCRQQSATLKPAQLIERLVEQYISSPGAEEKTAIEALLRTAEQYESTREFLEKISLRDAGDHERPGRSKTSARAEAVTLMTMHAAKGLEFPVVFICGVEEGMIPYTWRETDPDEERRLFYVAMTRAIQRLYLTSAAHRRVRGGVVDSDWSPLVKDIPANLLDEYRPNLPGSPAAGKQLELF
ncbi:3'-5' exonuclease [Gemmatimonadota bacterium]